MMFNWLSLPTFAAMLLFWMLAAYVLTRSPRSAISATAVGAQAATAAYLMGQGMMANASTLTEWQPWARNLHWGATIGPALWYWLTTLLLIEQDAPQARRYLRWWALPFGILLLIVCMVVTAGIYVGDLLFLWSQARPLPLDRVNYATIELPQGPLYPLFVAMLAGTTLGAASNAAVAWRAASDPLRRERFAWLLVSAALLVVGVNALGLVNWLGSSLNPTTALVPTWVGHLIMVAAMVVMAWNVAAYSLLLRSAVIKTDFVYFLTTMFGICILYGGLVLLSGPSYSFQLLGLMTVALTTVVFSHALVDIGRRALDTLFFRSDVRRLRSNLTTVVQNAALSDDLDQVLDSAQSEIAEVSTDRIARLTEHALRRLNNPSALIECELLGRVPNTVAEIFTRNNGTSDLPPTDLDRARALREAIVAAIEKLKPPETDTRRDRPAALQHLILREEYLEGLLNKQIMNRHAISEGTFHRNRRQAIRSVASELQSREEHLAGTRIGTI